MNDTGPDSCGSLFRPAELSLNKTIGPRPLLGQGAVHKGQVVIEAHEHISLEATFEDWYRASWPRLVAAVRLETMDVQSAEDAVADALVVLMEHWGDGSIRDPAAWVYSVAKRNAVAHRRRWSFFQRWSDGAEVHRDVIGDPDLWRAVVSLPPRQRSAICLRYLLDLTQEDVARAMGIAPGTAAALLNQARTRLRRMSGAQR